MAKRKRLGAPDMVAAAPAPETAERPEMSTPLQDAVNQATSGAADGVVPKAALRRRAPIADVAGHAAMKNALEQVVRELADAKSDGRMVLDLPLDAVDPDYILRDRRHVDEEDMAALMTSLGARGQQTPIEVVEVAPGRYGLISGWRRLQALTRMAAAGAGGTGTVQALVRSPASASEAYTAMVEENEIRAGLSYYERASIVSRSVAAGVFPDMSAALGTLFASASRAKRSKIKSFVSVIDAVGHRLAHPHLIGERLGLALAARIKEDGGFASRLRERLRKADGAGPEAELALLERAVTTADAAPAAPPKAAKPGAPAAGQGASEPGSVQITRADGRLVLEGPGVTDALVRAVEALVQKHGA